MKKFVSLILAVLTALSLCACGSTTSTSQEDTPSSLPSSESQQSEPLPVSEEPAKYNSYQAILDDYTVKIQEAVPGLVEEYKAEAATNSDGLTGLATICNEKVSKLAEISNDGISEMAEYYYKHGSGSYEEYSEWAGKIMDVYMEEASKIQDAYMESAK